MSWSTQSEQPRPRPPNYAALDSPSNYVPRPSPPSPPSGAIWMDDAATQAVQAIDDPLPLIDEAARIAGSTAQVVQLEARSSMMGAGGGGISIAAPGEALASSPPIDGTPAATTIGKAVLQNRAAIDLVAASLLVLIDERIESLRQERSNSEEAGAALDQLEDLKRRVEAFLAATSQFSTEQAPETTVVEKTYSLAAGISDWWSKCHVQICDKAFDRALKSADVALFGIAAGICSLAGAPGEWAIGISAALVSKQAAEVAIAYAKRPEPKSE
jgi:hypothetical protein